MLAVPIKGPDFEKALASIKEAKSRADLLEFRLDQFSSYTLNEIKTLLSASCLPVIFTVKGLDLQKIEALAELKPHYFDLESSLPTSFLKAFSLKHPQIKIILSYHDFTSTPDDLKGLLDSMQKIKAFLYKIAFKADSILDTLRLLDFAKEKNLIAISMGEDGILSRLLAPIFKNPIHYTSLREKEETAPGQIPIQILLEQYAYRSIHEKTAIYGLIGDPITQSISNITHNDLIQVKKLDAIYVKMRVTPLEIASFLQFAQKLAFRGLSVTMPLKEAIIPYLDFIDPCAQKIGAVNTLVFEDNRIKGFNTDGLGALDAIETNTRVDGKKIAIIGSGGACRAIIYEAKQRGAFVNLFARNHEKAKALAKDFAIQAYPLEALSLTEYDILINCTPPSFFPAPTNLKSSCLVMDINTKPKVTPLIEQALHKGCSVIYGYQMFIAQAAYQFLLWFPHLDRKEVESHLQKKSLKML